MIFPDEKILELAYFSNDKLHDVFKHLKRSQNTIV